MNYKLESGEAPQASPSPCGNVFLPCLSNLKERMGLGHMCA